MDMYNNVNNLVKLNERREYLVHKLERLKDMNRTFESDGKKLSICESITFGSQHTAHVKIYRADHPELEQRLLETTINHLECELFEIDIKLQRINELLEQSI